MAEAQKAAAAQGSTTRGFTPPPPPPPPLPPFYLNPTGQGITTETDRAREEGEGCGRTLDEQRLSGPKFVSDADGIGTSVQANHRGNRQEAVGIQMNAICPKRNFRASRAHGGGWITGQQTRKGRELKIG